MTPEERADFIAALKEIEAAVIAAAGGVGDGAEPLRSLSGLMVDCSKAPGAYVEFSSHMASALLTCAIGCEVGQGTLIALAEKLHQLAVKLEVPTP